ncbi:ASRGL1 [Mytilus coruscus]|uniref:ASRGL1 n=1 Tax=Mytilus coruscus TaxID=42192 RepID=A0A6J7ZXD8_MYTCO|nr:ASRGL1 [Mytilus coruscus]
MSQIPAIAIHGGAWAIPDNLAEASVEGVKVAAQIGYKILQKGGSAVDAVEAAVRSLEDDPAFDAGTGSVLNTDGEVEMDAVLMDGKDLKCGSVACIQNIKNPISVARLVMDKTDHVLLVGNGANKFAEQMGVESVETKQLVTEEAIREWEQYVKFKVTVNTLFKQRNPIGHDTVGAVAIDTSGNVAFGTSTGGITAKMPGRVGDSPIIGSGGYADNNSGAVSTTGHGESILKVCLAKNITTLLEQGKSVQEAAEESLSAMATRVQGSGGVVVVDKHGNVGKHFTTERMAWSWIKDNQLNYGLNPSEHFTEIMK